MIRQRPLETLDDDVPMVRVSGRKTEFDEVAGALRLYGRSVALTATMMNVTPKIVPTWWDRLAGHFEGAHKVVRGRYADVNIVELNDASFALATLAEGVRLQSEQRARALNGAKPSQVEWDGRQNARTYAAQLDVFAEQLSVIPQESQVPQLSSV